MNDTGNKNRAVESECGPFYLSQLRGAQSIVFTKAPYLLSAASVAGSKEAQGPLGKCFDLTNEDDLFGAETWEEAESNMQKEACVLALGKSQVDPKSVRYLFGGDLLRQGIATSMGVEDLQIPIFGLYGACSTSGEALALAAMSVAAGYGDYMLAVTSSHFGSAEKEFRFPLGYANQRPLSAHAAFMIAYTKIGDFNERINDTLALISDDSQSLATANISSQTIIINLKIALKSFADSCGLGGGIGSHPISYERFIEDLPVSNVVFFFNKEDANSLLLRIISELGLLGLAEVVGFLFRFWPKRDGTFESIVGNMCITYFFLRLLRYGHYFNNGLLLFVIVFILMKKEDEGNVS